MSEQSLEPQAVYFTGNVEGYLAVFQSSIQSKAEVVKMTVNVNNICAAVSRVNTYFKFTSDEVHRALLSFRSDYKEVEDHQTLVELFGQFHEYLKDVQSQVLHMTNGNIITQVISPNIQHPILTDDNQYYVMTPAHMNWWTKNEGLNAILEDIQKQIPEFKPWIGTRDIFIGLLVKERDRGNSLTPNSAKRGLGATYEI